MAGAWSYQWFEFSLLSLLPLEEVQLQREREASTQKKSPVIRGKDGGKEEGRERERERDPLTQ